MEKITKNILKKALPFWEQLNIEEKEKIKQQSYLVHYKKGKNIHQGSSECTGLTLIQSGQMRTYILSEKGNEITLYRSIEGNVYIMSAACLINSLKVEMEVEFEMDTELIIIPKKLYQEIYENNTAVKEYMLQMIAEQFSDLLWLFQQYVFSNTAKRLADALKEHHDLSKSKSLKLTHEDLAHDLGTAREVVTRMLKQFQLDGLVKLSRGKIEITNLKKLSEIK